MSEIQKAIKSMEEIKNNMQDLKVEVKKLQSIFESMEDSLHEVFNEIERCNNRS